MHLPNPPPGEALCNLDQFHWRVWGLIHTALDQAEELFHHKLQAVDEAANLRRDEVSLWAKEMRYPTRELSYEQDPVHFDQHFTALVEHIDKWGLFKAFPLVSSTVNFFREQNEWLTVFLFCKHVEDIFPDGVPLPSGQASHAHRHRSACGFKNLPQVHLKF